ncbi:LOW QUALITY PROTEIN: bolA-like protein 2 [Diceros bicornis minor]|uniref:LOW QUALITY PROTEIN: bolA-like protein 2 n=1 Tax=Diceros bicornis minor TaxID=77932 RepID=UPI0026F07DE5|nr:LOW QUALITY PROTEIN: bolA-like protein 2 [Diceros bicornis minor]
MQVRAPSLARARVSKPAHRTGCCAGGGHQLASAPAESVLMQTLIGRLLVSADTRDCWKARLAEGGSAGFTDAVVRAEVEISAEVVSVRAEAVWPGSEPGCRPRWAAAMELSAEYLREKLQRDLEAEHVEVEDTTPDRCASSFRVLVVSAKFEGKPLLQRHRLVNTCLAEELPHIHAFEQKTLTPEQWARDRQK